jgi:hypothetical protein
MTAQTAHLVPAAAAWIAAQLAADAQSPTDSVAAACLREEADIAFDLGLLMAGVIRATDAIDSIHLDGDSIVVELDTGERLSIRLTATVERTVERDL